MTPTEFKAALAPHVKAVLDTDDAQKIAGMIGVLNEAIVGTVLATKNDALTKILIAASEAFAQDVSLLAKRQALKGELKETNAAIKRRYTALDA